LGNIPRLAMKDQKKEAIRKLQKLGERLLLVSNDKRPANGSGFDAIKAIVREKREQKYGTKPPSSGESYISFHCPSCRMKLQLPVKDHALVFTAKQTLLFNRPPRPTCSACQHEFPRSFIARLKRKVRLGSGPWELESRPSDW